MHMKTITQGILFGSMVLALQVVCHSSYAQSSDRAQPSTSSAAQEMLNRSTSYLQNDTGATQLSLNLADARRMGYATETNSYTSLAEGRDPNRWSEGSREQKTLKTIIDWPFELHAGKKRHLVITETVVQDTTLLEKGRIANDRVKKSTDGRISVTLDGKCVFDGGWSSINDDSTKTYRTDTTGGLVRLGSMGSSPVYKWVVGPVAIPALISGDVIISFPRYITSEMNADYRDICVTVTRK